MKKVKKVSIDNFKSLELTNQNDLKGGRTSRFQDVRVVNCSKWRDDSSCRCGDNAS